MKLLPLISWLFCVGCVPIAVHAEPVATPDSWQQPALAQPRGIISGADPGASAEGTSNRDRILDRSSLHSVPGTSKTIEMLLEMQDRKPGLEGGEVQTREPKTRAEVRALNPLQQRLPGMAADPSNALGGGDFAAPQKPGALPTEAIEWTAAPGSRAGNTWSSGFGSTNPRADARAEGGMAGISEADVIWLLPRSWIRFVRQNRDAVVGGSFAVLALVWAGAAYTSRRGK